VIERVRLQQIRSWTAGEIRFTAGPQILWGANGAGKTTLMRLIMQELELDAGKRFLFPGARVGYSIY